MTSPANLDLLAGLTAAKAAVTQLCETTTGIHAVLFYGASGSGKSALVNVLTEAWLRQNPNSEEDRAVTAFRRGNSADVLVIQPGGLQNLITIDMIVKDKPGADDPVPLRDFFRTMPLMAKNKIAVIHDCDRMNASSANALLKTLEEPHPHAKLILTTSSIGKVPGTIRSRCLCVACELPSLEDLRSLLDQPTESEIRLSGGAPGKAKRLRNAATAVSKLVDFSRRLPSRTAGDALVASEEFRAVCDAFEDIEKSNARGAQSYALELLATHLAAEPHVKPRWIQAIVEAHRRVVQNGNAGIIFDAMFAEMLNKI